VLHAQESCFQEGKVWESLLSNSLALRIERVHEPLLTETRIIIIIITSWFVNVVGLCLSFANVTDSIIRILILDVADEDFVLLIPAFEVATSEFQ